MKNMFWFLLFISITMTALGGWLDMTGQESIGCVTKQHLWNDGLYLLLLLLVFKLFSF